MFAIEPDKLRICFEKTGSASYMSHLDLMRTMQRAFSRAGLPLKYSEGFNPHPLISIALPLPVGTESFCELMDFRLTDDRDPNEIVAALNAALPSGLKVRSVCSADRSIKELRWIRVSAELFYGGRTLDKPAQSLTDFFKRDSIIFSKKTKRGLRDADIAHAIHSIEFSVNDGSLYMSTILAVGEQSASPANMFDALQQLEPSLSPEHVRIYRLQTLDKDFEPFLQQQADFDTPL